jgi:hypothetical protein
MSEVWRARPSVGGDRADRIIGGFDMAKIDEYLDPAVAVPLVRAYFKGVEREGDPPFTFTGARFDSLARGGHRADAADTLTYDDIVAVSLLGVDIPARASLRFLGPDARRVASLLRGLPRLQRLADVDVDALHEPDHPAMQLSTLLRSEPGIGSTKASKLMARKRPHLIPVYDSEVGAALGPVEGHWRRVHEIVTEHGAALAEIRKAAGVSSAVSLLRVLDVAVWMRQAGAAEVRAGTGVDLLPPREPKKKKKKKKKAGKKG